MSIYRSNHRWPLLTGWALSMVAMAGCQGDGTRVPAPNPPHEVSIATGPDIEQRAIAQVIASTRSEDPYLRANAIEVGQHLGDRIHPMVQLGLRDDSEAVRFASTVTAGKLRLKPLVPSLNALRNDQSRSVQAAALCALRSCGEPVDITPLARMLDAPDPTLRGNVALLLGQMGDSSAIPMLRSIARQPQSRQIKPIEQMIVKLQIAEAIVLLGDESELDPIRAAAMSELYGEVRVMAVRMLGQFGDRQYGDALVPMLSRDPVELRVAAAESLARLRDRRGLATVLKACRFDTVPVRAQAALALAHFPAEEAAAMRAKLIDDPAEQVRIAAAAAILQSSRLGDR